MHSVFAAFFLFGTLNNILYVVILSAAIDLVGSQTPKAVVLLADILPALVTKLSCPFFIHNIPYSARLSILVTFSSMGMVIISISPTIEFKILGIILASISSGFGEVTFLQLTHYFDENYSISGFSLGTGGAGLAGSFLFLMFTNFFGISVQTVLLIFSVVPLGFLFCYYGLLPKPEFGYHHIVSEEDDIIIIPKSSLEDHIKNVLIRIKPLVVPYMIPLFTVYTSEYVINQGISPVLLFPIDDAPKWLILLYRDYYVVYGFLYQLGVFVSRSSIRYVRVKNLYLVSWLQLLNVAITIVQAVYFEIPFSSVWGLLILIFYEGLLGGLLYANTIMQVSNNTPREEREFSMGAVVISDSFGITIAGVISLWLEPHLCDIQDAKGRNWCKI